MDALKEHRLLLTIIGGVVLSILVYMMVVAPKREDASQHLRRIDSVQISQVTSLVRESPTAGQIRLRTQQRHEALRELYDLYRVYLVWGRPLLTYDIPGVDMERINRYRSDLAIYLDEMQLLYAGDPDQGIEGFRRAIPRADDGFGTGMGDEEVVEQRFVFAEGRGGHGLPRPDTSDEIELNRKQFWVLFELLQILREATDSAEVATGNKPYCQIDRLQLPTPPRRDDNGLYQGIPFELTLRASVEVWPRLIYALHESPRANASFTSDDLESIYGSGGEQGVRAVLGLGEDGGAGTNRIGLRFDRIRTQVQVSSIPEEFSLRLDREPAAQAIFRDHFSSDHWNDSTNRVIAPSLPESVVRALERIEDQEQRELATSRAFIDNQQAFLDRMIDKMYDDLRRELGPEASYLTVTITGEAIDFLYNPRVDAVRFWDRLLLTTDDVVEMLKRGVDERVDEEDEATWNPCEVLDGERTFLNPVYVPFEVTVRNGNSNKVLDPYTPYRMSETALRLVAAQVRPEEQDNEELD